jgi:hypothetical protein
MYDPDKERFPVSISSQAVNLSVEGTLSLSRDKARQFKQWYTNGLVRAEATMKTGGSTPVRVAMVNDGVKSDADGYILEYAGGEFITLAERKRREAAERDRLIFTDLQTGLMWVRDVDIAGANQVNWNYSMSRVKDLNYGGYIDWRLPTKDELASFVKRGGERPSEWFNSNGFNKVKGEWYWSCTEYDGSVAWGVDIGSGEVSSSGKRNAYYAWPVRDGKPGRAGN